MLAAATVLVVALAALPPAPSTVVLPGGKLFGAVKVDHRAHLQRRVACKACHPGPVGKIVQTTRKWHNSCRRCHSELARGPVECSGCHVKLHTPEEVAVPKPPRRVNTASSRRAP